MVDPEQLTHCTMSIIAHLRHAVMSISSPDRSVGHALLPEAPCVPNEADFVAWCSTNSSTPSNRGWKVDKRSGP